MSAVLYLFLAHLGVGIAFTLLLVSKEAGVKFFRFNAGVAAALIAAALAFRPPDPGLIVDLGKSGNLWFLAKGSLSASLVFVTVYWIIAGRIWGWLRRPLAAAASIAGAATVLTHGIVVTTEVTPPTLVSISMLSSAALLGGTCTSMVLGHWYLVIPSMEVRHLQKIVGFHIVTLLCRIAVVAVVLAMAVGIPLATGQSLRRYILSANGIFFWQRMLFGLAAPVVLSYMTWETAKIRSTQSATGILYVDFFTVVVGEVLASYLLLSTGLAL